MRLLLFDIDGTLVHSDGAGRAAVAYALERLFGTAGPIATYDLAGKTDSVIVHDLLIAAGVAPAEIEASLPTVFELMAEAGRSLFPSKGVRPCPGAAELVSALAGRPGIVLGLLTGNAAQTAPLKLAAAGFDPTLFRVGAFGSEARERNSLPALAMQRASDYAGYPFAGKDTIIIGDTPADVACARAAGATAVAVASGHHTRETLSQSQPDYLLDSLADTAAVLVFLLAPDEPDAQD
jgi:phosphoglycolate phosphatase-like HAD superfamily hydrolase